MLSVEQEIWDDFKLLSESSLHERLSYSVAKAKFNVAYDDNTSLVHNGLNRKLESDEDYKINQFLINSDYKNVDWNKLKDLYPAYNPIELPAPSSASYPPAKFRTHKERRDIGIILLDEWELKKEKLFSKIPNERAAKEYLINIRWDDAPICPHCGHTKIYILNAHSPFRCAKCGVKFSEKVGTMFENTKLNLLKWYEAMYLLTAIKTRKLSTHQLANTLSITQKTAWGIATKVKSKINDDIISKIRIDLFRN
jgi:transposase-like protein